MITKVTKIKNFGLFQDFKPHPDLTPFAKVNLFYGWNGSGKSTLSRLFRCFETKEKHVDYPEANFEIEDTEGIKYNQSFKTIPPIIKVFNTDFITRNLNLDEGKTEPIIYLSEENIADKDQFNKLIDKEAEIQVKLMDKFNEIKGYEKAIDSFHKNVGKSIKDFLLGTIHANVTYNKSTSEKIWENIKTTGTTLADFIKTDEILSVQKEFILLNSYKNKITHKFKKIDIEHYNNIQERVGSLAFKSIVNNVIERLKNDPRINNWAFFGLNLHRTLSSLKCEFCGQTLPRDRISQLEAHFSKDYKALQDELIDLKTQLTNLIIPDHFDIKLELFDFLRINYNILFSTLNNQRQEINNYIDSWIKLVEKKINNPFIKEGQINTHTAITNSYNSIVDNINNIIQSHNDHVEAYDSHSQNARLVIENHFVAQRAAAEELRKSEGDLALGQQGLSTLQDEMTKVRGNIAGIEAKMKNDSIAINEINKNLALFLGTDDIKLERVEPGGYELQRNGLIARNISEGEKTAIALVYFFAKLREQSNKIEDTIIVLDDPISSFDSNHLFHANFFIKEECEKAKQLFILTHNFYFFSLLKDWAESKLKIEYYFVKSKLVNKEKLSVIENADSVFKQFCSEYHFLFHEVTRYSRSSDREYIDKHVISNLCRQLLESFLTFKYGRRKLEKCFDEIKDFPEISKVRKFVNAYSHRSNNGASINGFNDNLFSEVNTIVPLVLDLIRHVDKVHYDSMMARLENK